MIRTGHNTQRIIKVPIPHVVDCNYMERPLIFRNSTYSKYVQQVIKVRSKIRQYIFRLLRHIKRLHLRKKKATP